MYLWAHSCWETFWQRRRSCRRSSSSSFFAFHLQTCEGVPPAEHTCQFEILSLVSLYKLNSFPLVYSELWELTFGISEKEHDEPNSDGHFRLKLLRRAICPTLMPFCTGAKLSKNLKKARTIKSISEHNDPCYSTLLCNSLVSICYLFLFLKKIIVLLIKDALNQRL